MADEKKADPETLLEETLRLMKRNIEHYNKKEVGELTPLDQTTIIHQGAFLLRYKKNVDDFEEDEGASLAGMTVDELMEHLAKKLLAAPSGSSK